MWATPQTFPRGSAGFRLPLRGWTQAYLLRPSELHDCPCGDLPPRSALFLEHRTGSAGAFSMVTNKENLGKKERDTRLGPVVLSDQAVLELRVEGLSLGRMRHR